MKKSEAAKILNSLMVGLAKFRSNAAYELGFGSDEGMDAALADTMPYVFDNDMNMLIPLEKVMRRYDKTGELEPMVFYNFMFMASRQDVAKVISAIYRDVEFPVPDPKLIANGWEPEDTG